MRAVVRVHEALNGLDVFGGRGSTASQRIEREFTPTNAAGKVLVPWVRECQQEAVDRCLSAGGQAF